MAHTEKIGDRIARLRRDRKIPQYKLAEAIGLHPSSLNQIEKGRRVPKTATITALAHSLGVSRDLLLDGSPQAAAPIQQGHENRREPVEVSAAIAAAVHEAIRNNLIDIINAISAAIATEGRAPTAERESERHPASPGGDRRYRDAR